MSAHLGDQIELYALGDLSTQEKIAVEAHLATCMECTRAVGEAELTVANLAELLPAYHAPRALRVRNSAPWLGAIAAAFVAGLLVAGGMFAYLNGHRADPDVRAQVAMVQSHFDHTTLTPVSDGAPATKVIFARDKAWLYAIADDGGSTYHLVAVTGNTQHDLGMLTAHGATASIFVEHPPTLSEIELLNGDRVVARGILR